MDAAHAQTTPGVATAVVLAGKVASSSTSANSAATHGRWILRGRPASVSGAMAWPNGLPLLHPGQTLRLLEDHLEKRTIKNFVHSYGRCFTGEDVIQCLVKDRKNQDIRTHAVVVLDYLDSVGVLVPIGHGKKLKSWSQRLFRTVNAQALAFNYGAVFVHVDKANGLIAENMSGTSNALAEVRLGDVKISTQVIRRDLNPVWNACFVFFVRFECSPKQQQQMQPPKRPGLTAYTSEASYTDSSQLIDVSLGSMGDALEGVNVAAAQPGPQWGAKPSVAGAGQPSPSHAGKRTELGISIQIYACRSTRGRTGIGQSSAILVRSVRPQRKSASDVSAVQPLTLSLLRKRAKDTNVLLAARTGFKQGKSPLDTVEDGLTRSAKAAKRNANRARGRFGGHHAGSGLELDQLANFDDDDDDDDDDNDGGSGHDRDGGNVNGSSGDLVGRGSDDADSEGSYFDGLQDDDDYLDAEFGDSDDSGNLETEKNDPLFRQMRRLSREIGKDQGRRSPTTAAAGNDQRNRDEKGAPKATNALHKNDQQYTNSKLGQVELRLAWVQLVPELPGGAGATAVAVAATGGIAATSAPATTPTEAPRTSGAQPAGGGGGDDNDGVGRSSETPAPAPPANARVPISPPAIIRTTSSRAELSEVSLPASVGLPEHGEASAVIVSPARSKPGHSSLPRMFRRESSRPAGVLDDLSLSSPVLDGERPQSLRRQPSKLNRILGKNFMPKKNAATPPPASVVLGSKQEECQASELARSRKVQYLEQRRQAALCHEERRAAIRLALENYERTTSGSKRSQKPTCGADAASANGTSGGADNEKSADAAHPRPAKEFAEDAEVEAAVRCFVFDCPDQAFKLLAGDDQQIRRAMWLTLAPFLPPLCHTLNAHQVFDALLLAQFGSKLNRALAMSSQVRALHYPVFELYVRSLKASAMSTEKARRKAILDFPALQQYFFEGEKLICIMDKVRGGRSQETAYRRSQYGGRLVVTTRAVYFAKKHTFSSNELVRENLWHALQVLESNGSVDFGLMIGFANKSSERPERPVSGPGGSGEPTSGPPVIDVEGTSEVRADLPGIDELFSRLAADRSLDEEDEEDEVETDGGPAASDRPASAPTPTAAATKASGAAASPSRFEIVLPRKTIARYVVFRFPAYGTWRKRDVDILKLRALIALRIFSEHVLGVVVDKYIVKVERTDAEIASPANKEVLLAASRGAAEAVALADLQSFKALVRMSEKRDWDWLSGVDTFEAFGDKWSWKRWCPLAFINLVCSAVQPRTRRSESLRARANESLFTLAIQLLKEAAATQQLSITWDRALRRTLDRETLVSRSVSDPAADTIAEEREPAARAPQHGPDAASMLPGQANGLDTKAPEETGASLYRPELATSRSSSASQVSRPATPPAQAQSQRADLSGASTRTSTALLESVDKWWLEQTKLVQSDIVRSATRLKSLGQNIDLLVNVLRPLKQIALESAEIYRAIITWESPRFTVGLALVSLVLILLGYTAYFCGVTVGAMGLYLMHMRHVRDSHGFRKLYVPPKKKKTLLEKYRGIKEKYQVAKKVLQRVNLNLLRVRSILTWENERVSTHAALWLIGFALVLTFTPGVVYELAIWGYIFTKKFRSGRMRRRIQAYVVELWNKVPPAPLWEKVDQHIQPPAQLLQQQQQQQTTAVLPLQQIQQLQQQLQLQQQQQQQSED